MTDGKSDQFIRKWEPSIIPKLKSVAAKEKGVIASLIEELDDQTDGKCVCMLTSCVSCDCLIVIRLQSATFYLMSFFPLIIYAIVINVLQCYNGEREINATALFFSIFLLSFSDEKCYTFLTVLTYLLPPMPGSRCSVKSAISFLVDFVPVCFLVSFLETSFNIYKVFHAELHMLLYVYK